MPKVDTTVRELVDMVKRGELRLPEMQRKYVWSASRVRDLLDSLYRGYPSGTILVWETDQNPPTRDLAVSQTTNIFTTQKMLLDGQQRLTSLCAVLKGEQVTVRHRKKPIEILFNLDHPEGPPQDFAEVDEDSDAGDNGFEDSEDEVESDEPVLNQRFSKRIFVVASKQLLNNPNWIRVSEVLNNNSDYSLLKSKGISPDNPKYEQYTVKLQKLRQIKEYPYVMQVLERGLDYQEVAEIFVRVNSLGVKLRGSDLALAQVTARWKNSLKLFEEFADGLDDAWSVIDVGLLVRAMVIFATNQSRFKTVQNISLEDMQTAWKEAKKGIEFAMNFLRTNAGVEDGTLLSSPWIILAVAAFGSAKGYKLANDEERELRKWVLISSARGHLTRGSTETIFDQDLSVILKTKSIEALNEQLKQHVGRLHVEPADFVARGLRSPLFATVYMAFKSSGAKDWLSGLGLSLQHQGKMHLIEYHHIFPKSLLAKSGFEKSNINEMANMAFISGRANRKILNKEPGKYLPEIIADRGTEALTSHCLPTDAALWEISAFPKFLEWRRAKLASLVNNFLGLETTKAAAANS
jgi:hypothetical protein